MNIRRFFKKTESNDGDTLFVDCRYDRVLLVITLALMSLGVVLIYSASIVSAEIMTGDGAYFLRRQLIHLALAIGAMVLMLNVHHELIHRLTVPLFCGAIVLLIMVLIPGLSSTVKGAARWIAVGPIRLQPSEVAKMAWVIALAWYLSRQQDELHDWRVAWAKPIGIFSVLGILLMLEPDFGSTLICAGMMVLMVWVAGARWLHLGAVSLAGLGFIAMAIAAEPYRLRRLAAFLSPDKDTQGVSYHINQALISFSSGGWSGLGLGESRQKLLYLPEAHTDFIFSILGEELGLIGVLCLIALFILFAWRGFRTAWQAPTAFGGLLAFGLTAQITFQAATNMAVATALLPTKGLTLPFISYGGSSLVTLGLMVGILLNISKREPPPLWIHRLLPERRRTRGPNRLTRKVEVYS